MIHKRANILLMSATITPRDSPELARVDPALRLRDYQDALIFYMAKLGSVLDGIVFVENSDSDITSLRALAIEKGVNDRVEFIANYGVHSYPGHDRSYGESRLLDHAMETSHLVAAAGADCVVWKVTGRYSVVNLSEMIATAPGRMDLYCDLRTRPLKWADLRFMGWTKRGFAAVFQKVTETLGEDPREPAMYHHIKAKSAEPGLTIVTRYRREPLIEGVRGWDNRHYSRGVALVKYHVRAIARRVVPFVHI